jgi:hypothetical protein
MCYTGLSDNKQAHSGMLDSATVNALQSMQLSVGVCRYITYNNHWHVGSVAAVLPGLLHMHNISPMTDAVRKQMQSRDVVLCTANHIVVVCSQVISTVQTGG